MQRAKSTTPTTTALNAIGQPLSDLTDAEGLRAHFNLPSIRTVNELRKKRALPCVRLGYRSYRYSISACAAALARLEIVEIGRPR